MLRIVVALSLMLLIIIKANTPETMLNQCENGKPNEIVSTFSVSELVMSYKGNTYSIVPFDYSDEKYLRSTCISVKREEEIVKKHFDLIYNKSNQNGTSAWFNLSRSIG